MQTDPAVARNDRSRAMFASTRSRSLVVVVILAGGVCWLVGMSVGTSRAAAQAAAAATQRLWNALDPLLQDGEGGYGVNDVRNPPNPICTTVTSTAVNVNTDCEGIAPHNETSIAVNPTDHSDLIGAVNDYQTVVSAGGHLTRTIFTRAHVSRDGGATWSMVPLQDDAYSGTGDPGVAFDADGRAYLSTLGFGVNAHNRTNADIILHTSTDGGQTWSPLVRIAHGIGVYRSQGVVNDHPSIVAWGHGNALVTWARFDLGNGGSAIDSPIYDSVTHDGGSTWTTPQPISGSAPFCIGSGSAGDTTCAFNQFASATVGADGSVHVAFESLRNADPSSPAFDRAMYLVVSVDPATGARTSGPSLAANLIDGVYDYPVNADGISTYQDSELRASSEGNIAADPTTPGHVAVTWSDMRDSPTPAPADPYSAVTNSDIVVAQSYDDGQTWSAPVAIQSPGDQFQPWAVYDTSGRLRIGYYDRSYDPANHKYGYTLASETSRGSLSFTTVELSTVLSDPTQGDRWYSVTANPGFPHATRFMGDYSGIASNLSGGIDAFWTDMRDTACLLGRCGAGEDAFFATGS